MHLVITKCAVDYVGRSNAHLPHAPCLLLVKADGLVSAHADDRAYKLLSWMTPPCTLTEKDVLDEPGEDTSEELWVVENRRSEQLRITIGKVLADSTYELGEDPDLEKDGVETHLQELLADQFTTFGESYAPIRCECPTPIGPVDLLGRDENGITVAVEVKRRGGIDGVEQLTCYLEMLNRGELLASVEGIFAVQEIEPQAKTLAEDRGIRCVAMGYDALRGLESNELRSF